MVKRKDGSHEVKEIQMKPLAGLTKEKLLRKVSKKAAWSMHLGLMNNWILLNGDWMKIVIFD